MNCTKLQNELPDLLLHSVSAPELSSAASEHLTTCAACKSEYDALSSTIAMLDEWTAPEPSAYFDQKLAVRLREEIAAPPMNWFERLQAQLAFNSGRHLRPMLSGALATVLLVGGGSYTLLHGNLQPAPIVEASSTVKDLQILDRNEQAFQQMDQLLQDEDTTTSDDVAPAPPPIS